MRIARPLNVPAARATRRLLACLTGLALLTACIPSNPMAPGAAEPAQVPAGAYFLRTIDGASLPVTLAGGTRIESGFVAADSTNAGIIGFGESVGRDRSASTRLATGTARVVGRDGRSAQIAAITWLDAGAGARADSVRWSVDSVIVYRTGAAPSAAGAGHRLIYTRAVAADTL